MWQFLLGLVVGFALGWWLDWYLSREQSRTVRDEMAQKNATIAKLQTDLLSGAKPVPEGPKPQAVSEVHVAAEPPVVSEPQKAPVEEITAYCVKCRANRTIQNPTRVTLSNGRPAIKGTCPVCSTGMFRMIRL